MPNTLRVAAYYAPAQDDPLWRAGCAWLGRDPQSGVLLAQPSIPGVAALTEEPRRYGFHATLKPPMHVRSCYDWDDVMDAARALADGIAPFALPSLSVQDVHGFLALRETEASGALRALADRCVTDLDRFRAPPTDEESTRRRNGRLSTGQEQMLARWGYPYVLGEWFFHMTLSRRLDADEKARLAPEAEAWFAEALKIPRPVDELCLFIQPAAGTPFTIAERFPLRG
jgi:putative phosphonate metabolism protein